MIKGNIEEMLFSEGVYITTTVGVSMFPLLRNRRDNVVILPKTQSLKKYDTPLYKRGNEYILHRIIDIKDNEYIIRGDNCDKKEYGIKDKDIIGVLKGVYRGNAYIDVNNPLYKAYSRIVVALHPVRMLYRKTLSFLSKIKHRIFRRS